MRKYSLFWLVLVSFLVIYSCKKGKKIDTSNQWISIFNGENLEDWTVKINGFKAGDNAYNTFRVNNGIIEVNYSEYDTFTNQYGHIFYKSPFTNYKLRLQYRFIGEQVSGGQGWATKNSGVMIHSQSVESMGLDQEFPVSLEVQFLGGITEGESRPTGNLCTPGMHVRMEGELVTNHCIEANAATFYGNEWVEMEVIANGNNFTHKINGTAVISYTDPIIGGEYNTFSDKEGEPVKGGYISLQSESHPIQFKNIEILELKN